MLLWYCIYGTSLLSLPFLTSKATEVLHDCCGSCPPEPSLQPADPVTGMDPNPFVRGPISWVTVNPGQQTIGSFHPITEGDWTEGACISENHYCRQKKNLNTIRFGSTH